LGIFKREINNLGIPSLGFVEPAKYVDFLDLTVSIENNNIGTRTYQK
jgi:hypothetical protein